MKRKNDKSARGKGGSTGRGPRAVLPVVALGASAGGLEALRQLFAHVPADPGMAFVVIQHLDPERPSLLTKVLEGITRLRVVEATSGMRVAANRVHVIPSGADLAIDRGVLTLIPRGRTGGLHLPIDSFFRSLAEDKRDRAIGVVLSGSGADGTEGLRAIKAGGGFAIVQEPDSAQFRGMPESAIAAGVVDFRGPPEEIARELTRLSRHPYVAARPSGRAEPEEGQAQVLATVFSLLRQHAGVDFSGYKRTTVLRRIERRMALRRAGTMRQYSSILRDDPGEARALARDTLIHVTAFFRDPEAFDALEQQALRELVRRKADGDSIRVWVPGCSTGEEAYSLAICLLEVVEAQEKRFPIKLFGSDLSEEAVEAARQGVFSESALAEVSPERVARFFERHERGYRVVKQVRDLCVFVKHDLTRDPPFAKLDLISCRNVLIYFDAELQRRVIPMLHYCLNPQGYLFLGQSETIGGFRELFAPIEGGHRIFQKIGESPRIVYPLPAVHEAELKLPERIPPGRRQPLLEVQRQADHLLLSRYAPPGVIVNDRLEIIQFRGRTGAFLEPPPGQPQANVLRMAREGLVGHLHDAIEGAKSRAATVRKQGLRLETDGETRVIDLEVVPLAALTEAGERYFLILFEEAGGVGAPAERLPARARRPEPRPEGRAEEADRLKAELVATKDYLQSLISEHQATTDELAATNEELVAANEELQSTNEELQSAKEELQSTNEELSTVNDQLRSRNQELDVLANDLVNVLSSVEIPVIIVDLELRVRRFTPTTHAIASLIPEDVGRPIDDLKLKVQVDDLAAKIQEVLEGLAPKEWEVQGLEGRWFRLQIRPYRTVEKRLDGAVLTFVDVDALKRAVEDAELARDYARSIVETVSAALVVLDTDSRVVSANESFHRTFARPDETAEGRVLFELGGGMWDRTEVRRALGELSAAGRRFTALELPIELPGLGRRVFSLTGRPIVWGGGGRMSLLAVEDITELRALEAERAQLLESEKQARLEAERANRAKDLFLATLSHELRTPLSTMLISAQLLRLVAAEDPRVERASASIERSALTQARLIDDLLDVSRIVSGKLFLDFAPVDLAAVVQDAVEVVRPSALAKSLRLEVEVDPAVGTTYGDMARLTQVVNNLLTNAIKFTPHGGRISVRLRRIDAKAQLTVADTGMGIRPEVLPLLFSRFVQADSSVTRTHGGLGLGLSIVRHLVEVHGGEVEAESAGEGKGATFRVTLPLGGPEVQAPAAPRLVARSISGVRVLLVEDDDDTREAYATMLTELGAVVRAAPSAAAGLAALEEFRPQVILSDIAMPGEDGFTFIRRVRRLDPTRGGNVPAAALTALASDLDRQRSMESGFQLHVAKPIDAARLAGIVGTLLDWKQPPTAPEAPS